VLPIVVVRPAVFDVLMFTADPVMPTVPVVLPIAVLAVPVVLILVVPVNVVVPVLLKAPVLVIPVVVVAPPTERPLVTEAEFSVARPDVLTVDKLEFPVTERVPPVERFPPVMVPLALIVVAPVSAPPMLMLVAPEIAPALVMPPLLLLMLVELIAPVDREPEEIWPLALSVETPEIAPALVMPPELLFRPPLIDAPPFNVDNPVIVKVPVLSSWWVANKSSAVISVLEVIGT
jgi:hypothetical protein